MATECEAQRAGLGRTLRTAGLLALAFPLILGLEFAVQIHPQSQAMPKNQTATPDKMEFEVASIRHAKPGSFSTPNFALDNGDTYSFGDPHGRFFADFPLEVYVMFAYKLWLTPEQTQAMLAKLPKWVSTDSFVIEARARGNPTKDQMRLMLQLLLADRFKLAVHFETRQEPALALVLERPGKTGPKLRPHSMGPPCEATLPLPPPDAHASIPDVFPPKCGAYMLMQLQNGAVLLGSRDTTMQRVADSFPFLGNLGRPVVDQTGLTATFDFTLNFVRESNQPISPGADIQPAPLGPTFLEALQEQLGLKLKPVKAPLKILVIDHVEEPSPN